MLSSYSHQQSVIRVEFLTSWPVLVVLSLVSSIGLSAFVPLFDLDEGAFSEATREMLASGNWVSTYLNGAPRHDKPILIYWLQAASVSLFGSNYFAFRLPSIICSLLWLLVVYRFAKESYNQTVAALSVWILSCSCVATIIFQAAIADALLNLLICATFFDIYRYLKSANQSLLIRIGLVAGLGFLTKGPVAVVLPFVTSLFVACLHSQFGNWFKAVINPRLWIIFLIVIIPWHVAVYLDQGWAFFEGFYLGHNLERFSETRESHGGSIFYYLLLLPILLAPFFLVFIRLLSGLRSQFSDFLSAYLWVWFFLVLLICSFSKTQLPHYILYGLTPLFILLANRLYGYLNSEPGAASVGRITMADLVVGFVTVAGVVLLPLLLDTLAISSKNSYDQVVLQLADTIFREDYVYHLVLAVTLLVLVVTLPRLSGLVRLFLMALLFMLTINFTLVPLVAKAQQQPVVEAATFTKQFLVNVPEQYRHRVSGSVISYQTKMPSFSVYLERIVPSYSPKPGDLIFTRISALKNLQSINESVPVETLFKRGGVVVVLYGDSYAE